MIERPWQDLGVFETNPTKSSLDIYYETSSSGLITVLNEDIGTLGPFSLRDASGNDSTTSSLQFNLSENDGIGSPLTLYFEAFQQDGSQCADGNNTMSIVSVTDGSTPTNDRTSDFSIEQQSAGSFYFRIISNSLFMHGENANTLESYTFVIRVTANGLSNNITLNNCRLTNEPPVLSNIMIDGDSTQYDINTLPAVLYSEPIEADSNLQSFEVLKFTVKNGSSDTSRDTEQVLAEVTLSEGSNAGQPHPYLTVDNFDGNGVQLPSNQFVVHPNVSAIVAAFGTFNTSLIYTGFAIDTYDSNRSSVPAGKTSFTRSIRFEP